MHYFFYILHSGNNVHSINSFCQASFNFLFQNLSVGKEEILSMISSTLKKMHIPSQNGYWIERTLEDGLSITTTKLKEIMFYVLQSGWTVAKVLTIIAMAPFLSFYIMKDWGAFIKALTTCIPIPYRKEVLKGIESIHLTFSAYLRGQALVCISLCGYYGIALKYSGLQFGWLIGVLIGVFSFIPYVSVFLGICVSFLIALLTSASVSLKILGVIFVLGYGLEALFLTPFLIGKRIGVHPIIVLLAIFSLGHSIGFVGVLLSAPLTAIVVAFLRLIREYYLKSTLYQGRER
ncbi:AI-2E family transporter [Holospora elegans]|uniref:AI-2E family transporter n=1 Tax=Holospora elegans TaxID=431043 RepID=UPI0009FD7141|nr:AI-2E family transporter [Holospora elegans]